MSSIDLTGEAIKRIGAAGSARHEIVKPDYSGLNLSSLKPTILEILGIAWRGSKPLHELEPFKRPLEDFFKPQPERLIIILVDSLSPDLLSSLVNHLGEAEKPYGKALKGLVTSTFPSVTPTALMTLYTGLPPLAHGILGFEFYLREADKIINPFKLDSDEAFQRDIFRSSGNLFQEAAEQGVGVCAFMPQKFASSPATQLMLGETRVIGYGSLADVGKIISGTRNIRLTYVYFSKLDEILHEEGPESHKIWGAIKEVQTLIHTSLVKGFGVILLSDHSFIKVDKRMNIKAGEAMMASNGGRVIYIYDENPRLEVSGAGSFDSFTRDRLIMDGWLGWGEYSERVGDIILVARENGFLTCGGKDSGDKATHGGFLAEEMMAPLALFSPP